MCGRFASTRTGEELALRYGAEIHESFTETAPRWNIAPTTNTSIVLERETSAGRLRQIATARWGLLPSWAKDPAMGSRTFNARSETVAEKPSFRSAFTRRRAIVPADGFYEWARPPKQTAGEQKVPYWLSRPDGLSFAGLHESWQAPDGIWVLSFTILTAAATGDDSWLHHRAPLLVPDEILDDWLAPEPWPDAVHHLEPAVPSSLDVRTVSTRVNSVRNEGPDLIAAIP